MLELIQQSAQLLSVVLDSGNAQRAGRAGERAQARSSGERAGEGRPLDGDQDPMLSAAVAAKLDVVGERCTVVGLALSGACLVRALDVGLDRPSGGVAEHDGSTVGAQLLEQVRGALVHRDHRPADGRELACARVPEQGRDEVGVDIRGEGQPPVLVGTRELDEALPAPSPGPATPDPATELVADIRLAGKAGEQLRERLGLFWLQRHAPCTLQRVPAPSRYRAQQLAKPLVVGKAQDGLIADQRCGEGSEGHEPTTIGLDGDASSSEPQKQSSAG